jgi:drug/metabolite transporter (DMT)-like permease
MFMSPGRTGAALASVLGNTGPVLMVLLAALVLHEPLTRRRLTALGLGMAGTGATLRGPTPPESG